MLSPLYLAFSAVARARSRPARLLRNSVGRVSAAVALRRLTGRWASIVLATSCVPSDCSHWVGHPRDLGRDLSGGLAQVVRRIHSVGQLEAGVGPAGS